MSRSPKVPWYNRMAAGLFHLTDTRRLPPPPGDRLPPHVRGRRFTFSHYNVVIPSLPEPHRHLACLALVGRPGMALFDIDSVTKGTPRTTATLSVGTAAPGAQYFDAYSVPDDCEFADDGTHIDIGGSLVIDGHFPHYAITIDRGDLRLELDVHAVDNVTWFVRSPVYQHLGYPARYTGTLTHRGEKTAISGILSLEHARSVSTTALRDAPVPKPMKLPWNGFSYQVVQLDPGTLLMLTHAEVLGRPMMTAAYLASVDGRSERYVRGEVTLTIEQFQEEPLRHHDGRETVFPHRFRWTVERGAGRPPIEIVGEVDTPLVYGLGHGWIGGYTYTGRYDGARIAGTGYLEYGKQ